VQFTPRTEFVLSRIGRVSVSFAIGLIWFLIWPVQNNLNILLVLLFVALFISRGSTNLQPLSTQSTAALGMLGALGVLGLVTSFSYGNIPALRTAALVLLVTTLGLVIGATVKIVDILRGLLLGTTGTVIQGWILALDDERFLEAGFFRGVTGSEPYEFFSVLVGLGSALALLRLRTQSAIALSPFLALFILTVYYLGLITAWLTTVVMVMAWFSLLVVDYANSQRARRMLAYVFVGFFSTTLAFLLLRPVSLELAIILGDRGSLEARYQIWDAVLHSMHPIGLTFGFGASFWGTGSPIGDQAREIMLGFPGNDAHIHAHSAYLDFLISFGVLGSLLGIVLAIIFIRRISAEWTTRAPWESRSAPWIFIAGLSTMGLADSAYMQNSAGWLFIGVLLGSYILNQSGGLVPHTVRRDAHRTT
jgi:hypothetical protein